MKKIKMKKALIDQILLGFILVFMSIAFVATVSDEYEARNKYYTLDKITIHMSKAMAKHYLYNQDMIQAQDIANGLLNKTVVGKELIDKNLIQYIWRDSTDDGFPNTITVKVTNYIEDNFWYRLLGQNTFDIADTQASAYVTKDKSDIVSINMRYGGSSAGFDNMIGLYEIDDEGNCVNARLIIDNRSDFVIGDDLGSYTNLDTKMFIVSDGYNKFGNRTATLDSEVLINNCAENGIPDVIIDNISNASSTYFQDAHFNSDGGYDHMQEVGKTYFDDYLKYVTPYKICLRWRGGKCRLYEHVTKSWEDWVVYADENNIDFANDPNDEYIVAMEDLPNGGDADFNDLKLDTLKIRVPRMVDTVDIADNIDVSPQS